MDKYYVYRPLLNLIGEAEGTAAHDGYNESLGYGVMLDGKLSKGKGVNLRLTDKTLREIDKIQGDMLADPDNRWNSSALGMYQIVRTTRRSIQRTLKIADTELFDEDMQDRMATYLLGVRGIDKYLAGRLKEETLLNNLAQEWASFPKSDGKGHYAGQGGKLRPEQVRAALTEVKRRHREGQPKEAVVPPAVEKEVKKKTSFWQWLTGLGGSGALGLGWLSGMDWQAVLAGGAILIVFIMVLLVLQNRIVSAIRKVKEAVDAGDED